MVGTRCPPLLFTFQTLPHYIFFTPKPLTCTTDNLLVTLDSSFPRTNSSADLLDHLKYTRSLTTSHMAVVSGAQRSRSESRSPCDHRCYCACRLLHPRELKNHDQDAAPETHSTTLPAAADRPEQGRKLPPPQFCFPNRFFR